MLAFTGSDQNLSYSRLVNASLDLFPYLSNLPNQSLGFSNSTGGYSIDLQLSNATTSTIDFNGTSYQLQAYDFSFSATAGNETHTGSGSVSFFPSSLVYGLTADVDGNYSVSATLEATDLSLSAAAARVRQRPILS